VYIYVYVYYIYVCVYIYMCVCIYICVYMCVYTYIYTWVTLLVVALKQCNNNTIKFILPCISHKTGIPSIKNCFVFLHYFLTLPWIWFFKHDSRPTRVTSVANRFDSNQSLLNGTLRAAAHGLVCLALCGLSLASSNPPEMPTRFSDIHLHGRSACRLAGRVLESVQQVRL